MRKITFTLVGLCLTVMTFAQTNNSEKIIELGKTYKDFMFRNEPTKDVLKDLKKNVPENFKIANEFIIQTVSTKNKLLNQQFLSRPDDQTLKLIYIIRKINLNLREENQIDNNKLIDSLTIKKIPVYELVDNYYGMLFTVYTKRLKELSENSEHPPPPPPVNSKTIFFKAPKVKH